MAEQIKAGDRVAISSLADKFGRESHKTIVEKVHKNGLISLHTPIVLGNLVKLPVGKTYNIIVHTKDNSGMFLYQGLIDLHYAENNIHFTRVKLLTDGVRIQQREFYRQECRLPLLFNEVVDDDKSQRVTKYKGVTCDISGNGVRFLSDGDVDPDKKIRCDIDLNGVDVVVVCDIKGKELVDSPFGKKLQYRAVFTGIAKRDQEKIIKFVYDLQRKQLKKT